MNRRMSRRGAEIIARRCSCLNRGQGREWVLYTWENGTWNGASSVDYKSALRARREWRAAFVAAEMARELEG